MQYDPRLTLQNLGFCRKVSSPTKNVLAIFLICSFKVKWLAQKALRLFKQLTREHAERSLKHIRPASRDVSNDARSGNANRHAPIRCIFTAPDSLSKKSNDFLDIWTPIRQPPLKGTFRTAKNKQSETIIRHDCSGKGCKPRHHGTAFRHYLLFTMYAEQASPKRCKLFSLG